VIDGGGPAYRSWSILRIFRPVAVVVTWSLIARSAPAQDRYLTGQFSPARFHKTSTATITTQMGNRTRHEVVGEDGWLMVQARDTSGGLGLEAWFDSLAVWRDAEEGRLTPETDGVIGGRYRGLLSGDGRYTRWEVPFVPAEIAEIVDLEATMDDLLPALSPGRLGPGESWSDSSGLTITRLVDSASGSTILRRYRTVLHVPERRVGGADSSRIGSLQEEDQRGVFLWKPGMGLMRWERDIVIRMTVPPGGDIRQTVRARVEQHVILMRLVS
jgi:hypothetical protein